ncbi:hypothetical protein BK025_12470 [Sodalis sp. TME1]|nr:hypothetical protein BK025_12470 [Sodalis sp. TME1]
MPISSISSSLSHYPFATSASSAYLVADLKNRIVTGDHNAFIAALENAKAADISIDVEIDSDKNTLLMYALRKGRYHIAAYLLEMGADHKVTDDDGNTVLMLLFSHYATDADLSEATRQAFLEQSGKLINKEGDINRANDRKETAAMIAISSGIDDDMLMTLFALMEPRGLNVNLYDADGHSAMTKAIIFTPGTTVVKKIIDMGFKVDDFATLSYLQKRRLPGADNFMNYHQYQYTPLYFAIERNDYDKVKILLDKGANGNGFSLWDVNFRGARKKITPLRLAEKLGHKDIVKLLMDRGFNDSRSSSRWNSSDSDESGTVSLSDIESYQDLLFDSDEPTV